MMRYITCLFLLLALPVSGIVLTVNTSDNVQVPIPNCSVVVTPASYQTNGGFIVTLPPLRGITDTNGSVSWTNVVPNRFFVSIKTTPPTEFWITITNGTPTNAVLIASALPTVPANNGLGSAYPMAASDGRYVQASNTSPVSLTNTGNAFTGTFTGNGVGLTNLLTGMAKDATIDSTGHLTLANSGQARSDLGLGDVATHAASEFQSASANLTTLAGGAATPILGTSGTTAAAGNDSRIVNAIPNLSGSGANTTFTASDTTHVPLKVTATSSTTANMLEVWDAAHTNVLFAIRPDGNVQLAQDRWIYLDPIGNAAMRWNPNHPGGGELEITSYGSLSLNVGYGNQGNNTFQLGSTGPTHEQVNFQYDMTTDAGHPLGYSKNVRWAATYWDGANQQYKYAGIRHETLGTTGNSRLVFYNPSPEVSGTGQGAVYSGGVVQGAALTNGWELDGKLVSDFTSLIPSSTYSIDFNGKRFIQLLLASSTTTFSVANIPASGLAEELFLDIYSELGSKTLAWSAMPANVQWIWRNEAGTLTAPTTLASSTIMFLRLKVLVNSSYTNIDASYTLGAYSPTLDADAAAFFTAASITDGTQKAAVNQLCIDLKAASLWTKMDCLYPFVGGNATAHSKNLKNPSGSFNITWGGTVTHNSSGVTGDGSTGFGDTGFTPSTASGQYAQNSASMGVYSKTASPTNIGPGTGNPNNPTYMGIATGGSTRSGLYYSGSVTAAGINNADAGDFNVTWAAGLQLVIRTASNAEVAYSGNVAGGAATIASTALPSGSIYVLAEHNTGPSVWHTTTANLSFAFIGSGLSSSDVTALNTAVVKFETTLSRQ